MELVASGSNLFHTEDVVNYQHARLEELLHLFQ